MNAFAGNNEVYKSHMKILPMPPIPDEVWKMLEEKQKFLNAITSAILDATTLSIGAVQSPEHNDPLMKPDSKEPGKQ